MNEHNEESLLIDAIKNRDTKRIKELISQGSDPNASDYKGWTCLMHAIWMFDFTKYPKMLIQHGSDVNAANKRGYTALMAAAEINYPDGIRLLLQEGANIDATDEIDFTAIVYAAEFDHAECAALLAECGADLSALKNINKKYYQMLLPIHERAKLVGQCRKNSPESDTLGL